jgi:ABC-type antimicrobial peptide transport system permease subunit
VLAIGLGALFGVLPARRATHLDPVTALAGK